MNVQPYFAYCFCDTGYFTCNDEETYTEVRRLCIESNSNVIAIFKIKKLKTNESILSANESKQSKQLY